MKNSENTIERVIRICTEFEILQKSRKQDLVYQRYAAMNYLRRNTKLCLTSIGRYIGGLDHATVINGLKVYDNMIATKDLQFKMYTKEIEERLNGRLDFVVKERPKVIVRYKEMRTYRSGL
jgi:chromosomal replication initiation ATPase DnaA